MVTDEITYGGLRDSDEKRRELANASMDFNRKNPQFTRHFPEELLAKILKSLEDDKAEMQRLREEKARADATL